jgi:phage head maturation protease
MKKSIDQLVAEYRSKWAHLGFKENGKGILVATKSANEVKLRTSATEFSQTKAYDPESKLYIAGIANAREIDRMNELLEPGGVMVDSYVKNSVFLMYHDHRMAVGQVSSLKPEDNGVHFEAWIGDPKLAPLTKAQEEARSLIGQRVIKAVSVGFIPHEIQYPTYNERGEMVEPAVIKRWEMLELSGVAVPCNAGALFDAKAGPKNAPKKVWSFPTLGQDGRLIVQKPKTEAGKMDEELKALLEKLGVSLDAIATGMNSVKDGITDLKKGVDALSNVKGKKPKEEMEGEEGEEEEEDDEEEENEDKKSIAALTKRIDEQEKKLADLQATMESTHKTVELLVSHVRGEQAA